MNKTFKKFMALMMSTSMLLQLGVLNLTAYAADGIIKNKMTFEDIEEGTSVADINGIVVNNGTATIVRDEFGSNAVKITSPARVEFKIDPTDKKYTELEFKVRSAVHKSNNNLYDFGAIFNDGQRIVKSCIYGNGMITYYQENSTTANHPTASLAASESYITIKYIINNEAKTFTVYKNGAQIPHYHGSSYKYFDTTSASPDTLVFNPQQGNSEYYIDDIIWSKYDDVETTGTNYVQDFEKNTDGLTASGSYEVVTESDGNKALKATGLNEIRFTVPNMVDDEIEVSYKVKFEKYASNTAVNDFGCVRSDDARAVRMINYDSGLNAYFGTNNQNIYACANASDYIEVKYILDMVNNKYTVYIDGEKKRNYQGDTWAFNSSDITSINNLYFKNQTGNIIYLDDIVIKKYVESVVPPTPTLPPKTEDEPLYESFDDYSSGDKPKSWTLTVPANSTITVEKDPSEDDADNMALKMVVGNSGSPTKAVYDFDGTVSKKLYISYDVKAENHTRSFLNDGFGSVANNGAYAVRGITYGNSVNYYFGPDSTNNANVYTINDGKYHHIELELDMENHEYTLWVDGYRKSNYASAIFGFYTDQTSVNQIIFGARYNSYDPSGAQSDDYGIYWIDNISVKPADLKIVTAFPAPGSAEAPVGRDITVTFNSDIDESSVNSENIKLYGNNILVNADVSLEDGNTIVIKPERGLQNGTAYKAIFSKNIKADMKEDIEYTFTTASAVGEDDPFASHLDDIENAVAPTTVPFFNFTIPGVKSGAEIASEAIDNTSALYTGKTWTNPDGVTFEFMKIKTEPFYYNSEWHDDTYAAAYIAYPQSVINLEKKLPAILILHGSGQTAQSATFYNNANNWAKAGYVVMAVDLPGIATPPTSETVTSGTVLSIPKDNGKYRFTTLPTIKANITYLAEATALKAFNLLYNSSITDKENVGITGISMGGYSTTLLTGMLGDKVKAAFSAYGCGFYEYGTTFATYLNHENTLSPNYGNPDEIYKWLKYYDSGRRAENVTANVFFGAAANDIFYYPSGVMKTYNAMRNAKSRNIYFAPNESHSSSQIGGSTDSDKRSIWKSEDSFFDYFLKNEGEKPTYVEFTTKLHTAFDGKNAQIEVAIENGVNTEITEPVLYYSTDDGGKWENRKWTVLENALELKHSSKTTSYYTVTIPENIAKPETDFYVSVSDSNEMSTSTLIHEGAKVSSSILYVDGESGTNDGKGTVSEPFKTITQAKEYIRNNSFNGDVFVKISGGVYDEALSFTDDDKLDNGGMVYYQAAENEIPVISGGKIITGWTEHENGIYKAEVNSVDDFRQLYIDGRRAVRARSNDSMGIKAYSDTLCVTNNTEIAEWNNLNDVEVHFAINWTNPILSITSANVKDGKAYFELNQTGYNAVNKDLNATAIYSPDKQREAWYVENAYELLDERGEWYFDKSEKMLYYKPMPYEDINSIRAIVPVKETLVSVSGTESNVAENIIFDGLQLKYTTWLKPSADGFYIGAQNNIDNSITLDRHGVIYSGAVEMKYANNIQFKNCVISSAGSNGIVMREGVKNTSVTECNIFDIAGGGIYVGPVRFTAANAKPSEVNMLKNILIADNIIHNTGEDYKSASAVSAGFPVNASFIHNEIYNTSFDGFHIGYGWMTPMEGQTGGAGITISNNYLHDIMTSELYDGGAIYTLGGNAATAENPNIVSGNYIRNQYNLYGALYNDQGSNNWLITENIFDNTEAEAKTGKTINWLHWHISSIKDCVAKDNYSTTDAVYDNTSGNSTWSDVTVFDSAKPSDEILEIINNVGVRKQNTEALSVSGKYENNSFVMSINGAFDGKESKTASAFAAIYKDGRFVDVKIVNVRLNNGVKLGDEIKIADFDEGEYVGKAFLWDAGSITPLTEHAECVFVAEE